jgi:2-hydroxychromene-2-carboxylate isomerase
MTSSPIEPIEPIEVFADLWCTFAHAGLRFARERRTAAGLEHVPIVVRAWPLELVNHAPMDPQKVGEHVHELQEFAVPHLFQHVDLDHFPTSTLDGLALTAHAYAIDVALGERTAFALRDALFEHGQDIGDIDVLRAIADDLGTGMPDADDHATVLAEFEEGRRRGVIGSPHYFHGERQTFCPALDIERGDARLTITTNTERLDAFLASCFSDGG